MTPNLKGALFMVFSMAGYAMNDAMVKLAADDLPLFQVVFVRGVLTVIVLALLTVSQVRDVRSHVPAMKSPAVGARVAAEMAATVCFLTALVNMSIANVSAIMQAAPFAVTLAAALVLGETVTPKRYAIVAIGFIGVLIIIRPATDNFTGYSLLTLLAVGFVVIRDLATKRLPANVPSVMVATATGIGITAMAAAISVFTGWRSIDTRAALLLGGAAAFLTVGYVFSIRTIRVGDVSFTAPFRYSGLVLAMILAVVVFSDVPDLPTIIGSIIVVAVGLYSIALDRQREATTPGVTSDL